MKLIDFSKKWGGLHYPIPQEKSILFLHHTAGLSVHSSEEWLRISSSKSYREKNFFVGVNYFVGLDGTIIKAIPEEYWAWHSGTGNSNIDKSSISIELENLGYLNSITSKVFNDLYNREWVLEKEVEDKIYLKHKSSYAGELSIVVKRFPKWRGFEYYHLYSKEQIDSLIALSSELFSRHPIPKRIFKLRDFLPDNKIYERVREFKGVVNHSQFLGNKVKWDLSIAFSDWYDYFVNQLNLSVI